MPELAEPPQEPQALTVRVDVDETRPPVWRRLVLHGDLLLDEVHAVLQAAFGWQDYHLHKFWPGPAKRVWRGPSFLTEYDLSEGEEGVLESEVRLDQLLRAPGDRVFYTYDFGDEWTHTLRLESVGPLEPLLDLAPARVVELAGDDGIPLTAAGWMRPAYVERVYLDLGMEEGWIGKGNREEQTLPVAQLRALCQEVGLLRKHKGRLLRTRLARDLSTDEEYVAAVTNRMLHHRDTFVTAARALFAVLTAATGRPAWEHSDVIARILTGCGLRTGPLGVDPGHVSEWVRPVRATFRRATGERLLHDGPHPLDHRAVALARAALWPLGQVDG